MKWFAALVALFAVSCGGGSSSSQPPSPLPPVVPHSVMYGYFGECDGCIEKIAGHVNVVAAMGWSCSAWPVAVIQHSQAAVGMEVNQLIVSSETCCGIIPQISCLQILFDGLKAAGLLGYVKVFYPVDEPETKGMTDAQVSGVADTVRQLARSYPELSGLRLAVGYGPGGNYPGVASYDLVGEDNYGNGPQNGIHLSPTQQRILFPGGADPWREIPDAFVQEALTDASVGLIWVFSDLDNYDHKGHLGVLSNGMLLPYCKAGLQVTGKQGVCNG